MSNALRLAPHPDFLSPDGCQCGADGPNDCTCGAHVCPVCGDDAVKAGDYCSNRCSEDDGNGPANDDHMSECFRGGEAAAFASEQQEAARRLK